MPGILNVLLGHLRDVLTLPKHEIFKIPQSAAHVVAHMNAHSNPALPFIEIGCAHPDGGSPLDKSLTEYSLEMYHGYRAYAHQMGVVCPLPLDKFNDLMAAGLSTLGVGFKKSRPKIWVGEGSCRHRTSGRETWTGVALTPTWAENGRAWARAHGDDHYKTEPETDPDVLQARLGAAQREVERLTTLLHRARKLGTP